jgi:hypothetical protein
MRLNPRVKRQCMASLLTTVFVARSSDAGLCLNLAERNDPK